ncbi:MAG: PDGLE domain-containing protein [Bacteroidia bacterium]|nr:PDGLE domain-containing protein [Bacteroidia bacterium]
MLSGKEEKMKPTKLQKKILYTLLGLCIITPVGIFLPMIFDAGDAWGEWSAETMKDLVGYVPAGLEKYSELWKAPIPDYTISDDDTSFVHQSGNYIVSGIIGTTLTYVVMLFISKLIVRNGE